METPEQSYLDINRRLWNDKASVHFTTDFYDLPAFRAGKNMLTPIELAQLGDVRGKTLLHLQCHFGMDTLSWARLGAQVTGVDFSDVAI
ncbi:MAG TPA: SAM-dependent methyltransferase, partial [Saprospiraceae bacterium]|nr:SAM-dependent methyltransferase [Saprospiraceae bacterium]